MMNLTSVKYQDSCIYIGLNGSREQGSGERFLEQIKNLYAIYKIKAYDNYVRDTILVKKKDLSVARGEIVIKFELNQLHKPDECEIEIISLKFIFQSGKREELTLNQSYPLIEIRGRRSILTNRRIATKNRRIENTAKLPKKPLFVKQEVIIPPFETIKKQDTVPLEEPSKMKGKEENEEPEVHTIIENRCSSSEIVATVESNVERKLDAQSKKLELELRQLCYGTIDLLLTSLPQPELAEEYRTSTTMVNSIRRYISDDLLQKKREEGESA